MASEDTASERLAEALADYRREFEKQFRPPENQDAKDAAERIKRARALVEHSGLGHALVKLDDHTEHWHLWSQRDNFHQYVAFPADAILAKEEVHDAGGKTVTVQVVLFSYKGTRYALRRQHERYSSSMDVRNQKLEFLANGEVVLGLDASQSSAEFDEWGHYPVAALHMGDWSKALLEIATYIENYTARSVHRFKAQQLINNAKKLNI
jgi:hypothetical protein